MKTAAAPDGATAINSRVGKMRLRFTGLLLALMVTAGPALADGGPDLQAPIWTWPGLFDSPGGSPKQFLRDRGIYLDMSLTQTLQGIIQGDGTHDWKYGGKVTVKSEFDGGKLGLWNGFYVQLIQEWEYGKDLNSAADGTLLPTNSVLAFPRLGGHDSDTSINVTQKFGDRFSISVGKFNLLDMVAKTPLVGGGGLETFLNAALAGPITGVIPPYLAAVRATMSTDFADFMVMVYDPRNAQDNNVITYPFEHAVSVVASMTVPVKIADKTGYYGIRGVYSTNEGFNLANIPDLAGLPPGSTGSLTKKGYWYVNGSVQQFIYEDPAHPGAGWGIFGYASIADGNPNPIKWTAYVGLGGTNPLFDRYLDRWGIAYFRYGLSEDLKKGAKVLGIGAGDEQGIEAFYNLAVTPWFRLTADVQWIDPAQTKFRNVVVGLLRAQTRF